MNEEFALDPDVASRIAEFRLLLSKFGFYEGRFIARFPRRWIALALEAIADQDLRQRVQVLLERAKGRVFLPSGREFDSAMPWIENAIKQHSREPFHRVISTEKRPGVAHFDELDPADFPGSRDARIVGSVDNIKKTLKPLLRLSGNLVLVDPYFKPWEENTKRLLTEVIRESLLDNRCIAFKAFVSEKEWHDEVDRAGPLLDSVLPANIFGGKLDFSIVVCRDFGTTTRLHSRYLFSEKGGVRLDKGLQTAQSMIDVSFIDKSVHEDLMRTFVERPLPFAVMREFPRRL